MTPGKKPSYKDALMGTALGYLVQSALIAITSFGLSFVVVNGFKLSGLVDLAVLLLFVQDIENLPEKAPKLGVALKRIGQASIVLILSLLLHDILGEVASGLLILFLVLGISDRFLS